MATEEFAAWQPLVAYARPYLREASGFSGSVGVNGGHGVSGVQFPQPPFVPGRAMQVEDYAEQHAPFETVREALRADGLMGVDFKVNYRADGAVTVRAVLAGQERTERLGHLTLVEGAMPEPYRRRPAPPAPGQPRGPVDLPALEQILRALWPNETGMSDAELDAYETASGLALPPEARVLYSATRGRQQYADWAEFDWNAPVPFDVWALDEPWRAEPRTRYHGWSTLARTAGNTASDDAIQALSQPPEWFVLGNADTVTIAIDTVPGPAGKVGQVIGWSDESRGDQPFGARVLADSLLAFVRGERHEGDGMVTGWTEDLPEYGEVTVANGRAVSDVASPELEVLYIVKRPEDPATVAEAAGLPRLRTLVSVPGSIKDPLELGGLGSLEYLETGPAEWRALLDAGAVPRGLLACAVTTGFGSTTDPQEVAVITDELRTLFGLEPSERAVTIDGRL
ncbi:MULTISPECIES: SMI1/KNR4 family protein [unclassified Isoptericola]|uniref:hypothetical protein n=1 Tax=unclassified Isoptericola TaxID=2623355 RepID=UPI00364D50DE